MNILNFIKNLSNDDLIDEKQEKTARGFFKLLCRTIPGLPNPIPDLIIDDYTAILLRYEIGPEYMFFEIDPFGAVHFNYMNECTYTQYEVKVENPIQERVIKTIRRALLP